MKIWMLLMAAAFGLLVAPVVSAELLSDADVAASDEDFGLDFDDLDAGASAVDEVSNAPDAPAASETAKNQEADAPAVADGQPVATPPAEPLATVEPVVADVAPGATLENEPIDAALAEDGLAPGMETQLTDADAPVEAVVLDNPPPAAKTSIGLGPMAVDDDGQVGRIHTVGRGDTLWDISNAYLGTPWVWPSVWNDNDGISNPHRIAPGDRIWITAGEMRIVTDRQAEDMISAVPEDELADADFEPIDEGMPASLGDEDELMEAAAPTSMDELPVAVATDAVPAKHTGAMVRVSEAESLGYVSPDTLAAAGSIVDSSEERVWLAEGDSIVISLGEGQVQAGDEFTIYRDKAAVRDLDGTLLGYHVEVLGWAVVQTTDAESSVAEVRQSQYEIRISDNVIPRDPVVINVSVKRSPDALPGHIIYMPDSRTAMADGEWVYINRGNLHGVEPGTELEVYMPGRMVKDRATGNKVLTPDHVVAQMIVVNSQPDSAVAYIVHSQRELSVGDKVRPIAPKLAQR